MANDLDNKIEELFKNQPKAKKTTTPNITDETEQEITQDIKPKKTKKEATQDIIPDEEYDNSANIFLQ